MELQGGPERVMTSGSYRIGDPKYAKLARSRPLDAPRRTPPTNSNASAQEYSWVPFGMRGPVGGACLLPRDLPYRTAYLRRAWIPDVGSPANPSSTPPDVPVSA